MVRNNKMVVRMIVGRRQNVSLGVIMLYQMHHTHLHDTGPNNRRYPHLINSVWNLHLVHADFHMSNPSWTPVPRWSLRECDRREAFLKRHPLIAAALNGVVQETHADLAHSGQHRVG